MDYLKERKPEGGTNRTTTAVTMVTANGNHSDLEGRLGRLEADFKQQAATAAQLRTTVIEKESEWMIEKERKGKIEKNKEWKIEKERKGKIEKERECKIENDEVEDKKKWEWKIVKRN